jgi:hypothetical protein
MVRNGAGDDTRSSDLLDKTSYVAVFVNQDQILGRREKY